MPTPPYIHNVDQGVHAIENAGGTFYELSKTNHVHGKKLKAKAILNGKYVYAEGNTPTETMFNLVNEFYSLLK